MHDAQHREKACPNERDGRGKECQVLAHIIIFDTVKLRQRTSANERDIVRDDTVT
jgi:hypothetical protein